MKEMTVKLTFTEDILGTANANKDIHEEFIASKAPDAPSKSEEVEALGAEEVFEKGTTIFPKDENGNPFIWNYQIEGFFKETCSALRKVTGTQSSKMKAFKKEIDGLIFVTDRKNFIEINGGNKDLELLQRPLRAQTAQGERVSLATSEVIPAGSTVTFTVMCMVDSDMKAVEEWLNYGKWKGLGQWRNSGFGRFTWEEIVTP